VAAFTSTPTNLAVAFDASGSKDPDGTIAGYAWDFGDTSSGTGVSPNHTYATAGTYTVGLTVTDNSGATTVVSHTVTVAAANPSVLASDAFNRTVAKAWGTADAGGAWTVSGGSTAFNVSPGAGNMVLPLNTTLTAMLNSVMSTSAKVTARFSLDKLADSTYVTLVGRQVGADAYTARLRVGSTGAATVYLLRSGTQIGKTYTPAFSIVPGQSYNVSMTVSGAGTTTVSANVWPVADTEPGTPQTSTTDTTAALQAAGSVGVSGWIAKTSTNAPVTLSFAKVDAVAGP
jgi:PKD repeat protein